jgi:hypothetical protein
MRNNPRKIGKYHSETTNNPKEVLKKRREIWKTQRGIQRYPATFKDFHGGIANNRNACQIKG